MKKFIFLSLLAALPLVSQESSLPEWPEPGEDAARYTTRDTTALSIMGWGVALAVGIVSLVCLIKNHPAPSTTN